MRAKLRKRHSTCLSSFPRIWVSHGCRVCVEMWAQTSGLYRKYEYFKNEAHSATLLLQLWCRHCGDRSAKICLVLNQLRTASYTRMERGGTAAIFLNLEQHVDERSLLRLDRFIPWVRSPATHWIGGLLGLWDGPEKCLDPVWNRIPTVQHITHRHTDWAISFPKYCVSGAKISTWQYRRNNRQGPPSCVYNRDETRTYL